MSIIIEFCISELVYVPRFTLNKGCFWSKTEEEENITIEIRLFQLVYKPNFSLNKQF